MAHRKSIVKSILAMLVLAFCFLSFSNASAASKPKTLTYKIKNGREMIGEIIYVGEEVKKKPHGEGKLFYPDRGPKRFIVQGIFDNMCVSDAELKFPVRFRESDHDNEVTYNGPLEISFSEDGVSFRLIDGSVTANKREYFSVKDYRIDYSIGEIKWSNLDAYVEPEPLSYSLSLAHKEISPFSWELLKAFGGDSIVVNYNRIGTLRNCLLDKYSTPTTSTLLRWRDGRVDTLDFKDGDVICHGIHGDIPSFFKKDSVLTKSNGDSIRMKKGGRYEITKVFSEGVLTYNGPYNGHLVGISGPPNVDVFEKTLQGRLSPYVEYYPWQSSSPYKDMDFLKREIGGLITMKYNDGTVFYGGHYRNPRYALKVLSWSSLPDFKNLPVGVFTKPDGRVSLVWERSIVTEQELIARAEANKIEIEESARLQEEAKLKRELEERRQEETRIKTYGKYYTEFRENGTILLGTPIKMLKELAEVELEVNRKDRQIYSVYIASFRTSWHCGVDPKTGRVTSVSRGF